MSLVKFQDYCVDVSDGDTVLEAFEKASIKLPNSCRAGLCQACLMVVKSGTVPAPAQQGLSSRQLRQNLFYACQCQPLEPLEIALPGDDFFAHGVLTHKQILNAQVLLVRFRTDMRWEPGQYTTVWKSATEGRTFSIASLSGSGELELHLRRRADGVISHWLETEVEIGTECQLSEARGQCFYALEDQAKPMILAATGTGLSPLLGVVRQALACGHTGPISLYAAAGEPSHLYLQEEIAAIAAKATNLHYYPVVRREGDNHTGILQGDLVELVASRHKVMGGHAVFICGAPTMVNKLKKIAFLQGASMSQIYTDAFEGGQH